MSIGPGYACVSCSTMLRPRKNEIYVLIDSDGPYQVWCADLWECPKCSTQIILGYGQQPIATRHKDDFDHYLNKVTHTVYGKLEALS